MTHTHSGMTQIPSISCEWELGFFPLSKETHDRISLVVFTGPGNDTIVEPLPGSESFLFNT